VGRDAAPLTNVNCAGLPQHGLEDRLERGRRVPDDLEHRAGGRLLLDRLGQIALELPDAPALGHSGRA
jgi:hypothetical protein